MADGGRGFSDRLVAPHLTYSVLHVTVQVTNAAQLGRRGVLGCPVKHGLDLMSRKGRRHFLIIFAQGHEWVYNLRLMVLGLLLLGCCLIRGRYLLGLNLLLGLLLLLDRCLVGLLPFTCWHVLYSKKIRMYYVHGLFAKETGL